jgi:hypothetical protein
MGIFLTMDRPADILAGAPGALQLPFLPAAGRTGPAVVGGVLVLVRKRRDEGDDLHTVRIETASGRRYEASFRDWMKACSGSRETGSRCRRETMTRASARCRT